MNTLTLLLSIAIIAAIFSYLVAAGVRAFILQENEEFEDIKK